MFKKIEICLSEPLCTCPEENLSWSIPRESTGRAMLRITCETCGVFMTIPNKVFLARFQLDKPYPGKLSTDTKKTVLKSLPEEKKEGKVLEFRQDELNKC